jgi:hypothetical protein
VNVRFLHKDCGHLELRIKHTDDSIYLGIAHAFTPFTLSCALLVYFVASPPEYLHLKQWEGPMFVLKLFDPLCAPNLREEFGFDVFSLSRSEVEEYQAMIDSGEAKRYAAAHRESLRRKFSYDVLSLSRGEVEECHATKNSGEAKQDTAPCRESSATPRYRQKTTSAGANGGIAERFPGTGSLLSSHTAVLMR